MSGLGARRARRRGLPRSRWPRVAGCVVALAAVGCNVNPYCINCGPGDFAVEAGAPAPDLATAPDLAGDFAEEPGDLGESDACGLGAMQLAADPNNCGACGHACSYPNARGACHDGGCAMGDCLPGFYDLDHAVSNGCEYPCFPLAPAKCASPMDCPWGLPCANGSCAKPCAVDADCPKSTTCDPQTQLCEGELCNGRDDNCDGQVDEGFDFLHDVSNCGACGLRCAPDSVCTPMQFQSGDGGASVVGTCHLQCPPCNANLDGNPNTGCSYKCPVCPPGKELCNGVDDDCDGVVDNAPIDVGQPCDNACPALAPCVGQKACAFPLSPCVGRCCGVCTPGTTWCAGGQKVCQPGVGPKLEVCNGLDDNCDGQIDEDFDLQGDPMNCGACGKVCSLANAVAGCTNGACVVARCEPGFADADRNPANGCEYACPVSPPTVEVCNGVDDDCDGVVDDHLVSPPANYCNQTSICAGTTTSCHGKSGWFCEYQKNDPHIEVDAMGNLAIVETLCDGFDGNCNGAVDETFVDKGKPCGAGVGACRVTAALVCSQDKLSTVCPTTGNPMAATDEACNGIDDDCDGQVDERNPANNAQCYNGGPHACRPLVEPMVEIGNSGVYVDPVEASRPDATAQSPGSATNRACAKPGTLPWATVTWAQAQAACAAIIDSAGKPMRLCDASEWAAACDLGDAGTVWSYAKNPGTYQAGTCNDVNANAGKTWPTATGASCYAPMNGGKLFDLSGNLAEWTRTAVVTNNVTYYKVRGGAYNGLGPATSCNFDFAIERPGYQFADIGFRCCADSPP